MIGKNIAKNQLIVGFNKETEIKEFIVKDLNWIDLNYQFSLSNFQLFVRIRHQGKLLKCIAKRDTKNVIRNTQDKKNSSISRISYHVFLSEPERGIAPGQSAVFYIRAKEQNGKRVKNHKNNFEVLGGGIISL